MFRRDPSDVSKIYFLDPVSNCYVPIPYRNLGRPAVSAWEAKDALAKLKAEGRRDIDENLLFQAIDRLRVQVEVSVSQPNLRARRTRETRRVTELRRLPLRPKNMGPWIPCPLHPRLQ